VGGLWTRSKAASFTSEGLALVSKSGKYGFIDKTGRFIIAPQFDNADSFSEGLAPVSTGGSYGFINETGRFVISPQFASADSFSEGLASVQFSDGKGYIDTTGRIVINLPAGTYGDQFSGGLATVRYGNGTTGYIDKTGGIVSSPREYIGTSGSQEGLTCVLIKASQKWGCMNKTGQFVIPAHFDMAYVYQGLVSVSIGDNQGWMDTTGNYVWRPTK